MKFEFKTISLFLVVILWGTLLGGIVYEHLVFLPVFLSALPDSAIVVNGVYGLHNVTFWQAIHPILISSIALALTLNWKLPARRKLIIVSFVIYILVLTVTFLYFVPELMRFQNSQNLVSVTPAEWLKRGQLWQQLSMVRGAVMYANILPLLIALTKQGAVDHLFSNSISSSLR